MVPNLNLLSSLTTLAVKKQAQFNEKKISTRRPILIVKKIIMQRICSEHETQKVVKSNQFFPRSVFPMPRSIWYFWTVIGGILTKKIEKKKIISANSRIFHSRFSNPSALGLPGLFVVVIVEKQTKTLKKCLKK